MRCRSCNGTGRVKLSKSGACPQCGGSGFLQVPPAQPEPIVPPTRGVCPTCNGETLIARGAGVFKCERTIDEIRRGLSSCGATFTAEALRKARADKSTLWARHDEESALRKRLDENRTVCPRCGSTDIKITTWRSDWDDEPRSSASCNG